MAYTARGGVRSLPPSQAAGTAKTPPLRPHVCDVVRVVEVSYCLKGWNFKFGFVGEMKKRFWVTNSLPQRGRLGCDTAHHTVKPQFEGHVLSPLPCQKHRGETAGSRRPPTSTKVGVTLSPLGRYTPPYRLSPLAPKALEGVQRELFAKVPFGASPASPASPASSTSPRQTPI